MYKYLALFIVLAISNAAICEEKPAKENEISEENMVILKKYLTPKIIYTMSDLPNNENDIAILSDMSKENINLQSPDIEYSDKYWRYFCRNISGKKFIGYGTVQKTDVDVSKATIVIRIILYRESANKKRLGKTKQGIFGPAVEFELSTTQSFIKNAIRSGKYYKENGTPMLDNRAKRKRYIPFIKEGTMLSFVSAIKKTEIKEGETALHYLAPNCKGKLFKADFVIKLDGIIKYWKWSNEDQPIRKNPFIKIDYPSVDKWIEKETIKEKRKLYRKNAR